MILNQKNKFAYFTFLPVSFLGFIDASYLTVKHFVGTPVPCSVLKGCEEVMTSQYSTIAGVPVAMLGAIYYLVIFVLIFLFLSGKVFGSDKVDGIHKNGNKNILNFSARLTVIGLIASLWFIYLQLFVINAICLYCMFSAFTSITLFALGIFVLKFNRKVVSQ